MNIWIYFSIYIILGIGIMIYYLNLLNPDFKVESRVTTDDIYIPRNPNEDLIGIWPIKASNNATEGLLDSLLEEEEWNYA